MTGLFGEDIATMHRARLAIVAIERGIDQAEGGLTYAVPDELNDLAIGERVVVPLGRGNKSTSGFVIARPDETELNPKRLKAVIRRETGGTALPSDLIDMARWMASYYASPLGMVLSTMLPAAVKKRTGATTRPQVRLRQTPPETDTPPRLTPLQQAVLDHATNDWIDPRLLADQAGARTVGAVKTLVTKGLLETRRNDVIVSDLDLRAQRLTPEAPHTLTADQQSALDLLLPALTSGFGSYLLHGVTGSGKTEVYLRMIASLRADHERATPDAPPPGVIVLVPEIALTPQTVARFLQRFDGVAVLHSGLTAAQRHAQWRSIADGRASIVVGARSALFAPIPNLRLIIVDEEHDTSYKQDQLPRYHARDCAIKRGHRASCPVVLGSATPSLESYYNCGIVPLGHPAGDQAATPDSSVAKPNPSARCTYVPMPNRVAGLRLPEVRTVHLREAMRERRGIHLMTPMLEHELQTAIDGGGQAMLLLNRRGYANSIACASPKCGWNLTCNHCDAAMVFHKSKDLPTGGLVRCHHCESEQMLPSTCPECRAHGVTTFGLGTQRVEEEIKRKFPGLRLIRMDSDTMRTGQDYRRTLEAFRAGEAEVLLGTQMIAKGLDFPNVRLVGVISADTSLHMPDFRAAERTFQLIAQVAGRAGRSAGVDGKTPRGRVVLQTLNPDDPTILLAAAQDYAAFAERELLMRHGAGLPPITRLARIVIRDRDLPTAEAAAHEIYTLIQAADASASIGARIRPPAPCPLSRVADHHRIQVEIIAPDASAMQRLLTDLRNRGVVSDNHTAIDVDPTSLL